MTTLNFFPTEATTIEDNDYLHLKRGTGTNSDKKILGSNVKAAIDVDNLKKDGSVQLTADWDAGQKEIRSRTFYPDVGIGVAPLIVDSTTKVVNLNVDRLDNFEAADLPIDAGFF